MIHETIPPHESEYRDQLIKMLKAKMTKENPSTMHRDAHPKQHGVVKATFKIIKDLPGHLAVGVFKPGKEYQCWVRFSNQNAPSQDDNIPDIRGAAIKLMNVPGSKLDVGDGNLTSQDFVTISTPMFITHNVKEFSQLIHALVSGKLSLVMYFLFHPRSLINLLRSNKCFSSPLKTRYWSTTPYLLGEDQAVKYSLIPRDIEKADKQKTRCDPDYLRNTMVRELEESEHQFDFCIQLQTDPKAMPIEDPGKRWSEQESPFIKVAELKIHQQTFNTKEQEQFGREMSFNPWHALPLHRPLGGINRARRVIYNTLSTYRHSFNQQPRMEPTDFTVPDNTAEEMTCPT